MLDVKIRELGRGVKGDDPYPKGTTSPIVRYIGGSIGSVIVNFAHSFFKNSDR